MGITCSGVFTQAGISKQAAIGHPSVGGQAWGVGRGWGGRVGRRVARCRCTASGRLWAGPSARLPTQAGFCPPGRPCVLLRFEANSATPRVRSVPQHYLVEYMAVTKNKRPALTACSCQWLFCSSKTGPQLGPLHFFIGRFSIIPRLHILIAPKVMHTKDSAPRLFHMISTGYCPHCILCTTFGAI